LKEERKAEITKMCLLRDEKKTDEFRRKHKGTEITVWKVYIVNDGIVYNAYQVSNPPISPGWIKSNRQSKFVDCLDTVKWITRGIHVYLTRKEARMNTFGNKRCRVFKCTALVDDLVAVGTDNFSYREAVFTEIHISREELVKGMKGRN